jgi:hypothetical protein
MTMIDYTIFYKETLAEESDWKNGWDLFLSAYTLAERVRGVFDLAAAGTKRWLLFPEYGFDSTEQPDEAFFTRDYTSEARFISECFDSIGLDLSRLHICVDITGFIRPYLLFLVRWLQAQGVQRFDAIYSEPVIYAKRDKTEFSPLMIEEVRQVAGYEGVHSTDTSRDLLLIGAGYDDHLIAKVAESKDNARKIQLFGFPSLRADMFQENVVRAQGAEEAVGIRTAEATSSRFAPAYDPFVTASVVQATINSIRVHHGVTNMYLSPLATKPQVLGFAIYYVYECVGEAASILFPFSRAYSKKTTKGLTRVWKYAVEFPVSS